MYDINKIRSDFPILYRKVGGHDLVYFDNAATSQKPNIVINAIADYYKNYNANVHRGIHTLAEEATAALENARQNTADFIKTKEASEIVFTSGTTASINLVAYSVLQDLKPGDEIITTVAEHHSNFVPWQELSKQYGLTLKVAGINDDFITDASIIEKLITSKTRLIAISHVSNVLGTVNPIKEITKLAHSKNILVLVDGAQSAPHMKISVSDLDCDLFAFSGHKMLAPTGIGVLYIKKEIASKIKPFMFGGSMIKHVSLTETTFAEVPSKFEAGTPNIEGAIGLGAGIDYLSSIGMGNINNYEEDLTNYALVKLNKVTDLSIYGPLESTKRKGIISFGIRGAHSHDVAQILDSLGIAVRAGHHCAIPLHARLGITDSIRASFYLYNTKGEIDKLIEGIEKAKKILR